ncbi:porin family protein [Vibrio sp. Y2-5]|uniref:outer membrane beta-barrel protein n=1 Tax=Vibrio sp. Y2-5 TaxID=2743977 RepID=UPI0016609BC5|nr:outer membrane beta-barrel protein [Vibrio sp. Y2-5]MBD0786694.1 porin family protein [Vibrio sp. Y2-5]
MKRTTWVYGVSTLFAASFLSAASYAAEKSYVGVGVGIAAVTAYENDNDDYIVEDDSQFGYVTYGGWMFNRIVGVEMQYTDYGESSKTYTGGRNAYASKSTLTLGANLGYTFDNGLRPFATPSIGVSWLELNADVTIDSTTYTLNSDDTSFVFQLTTGLDYTPAAMDQLTLRAAYAVSAAEYKDSSVYDIFHVGSMFFIGGSYNF